LGTLLADKSDFGKDGVETLPHVMFDKHNCEMYDQVHPLKWVNPAVPGSMEKIYDLVSIGGGAAGLISAAGASISGAKACIIERAFMGGDCLVTGCVPSKAFLASASIAHKVRTASDFGIEVEGEVKVNFPKLMERMRKIRAQISHHDGTDFFSKKFGLDIHHGEASFKDKNTIVVDGKEIKFVKAAICTGGRPRIPDISGLKDIPFYTSENIFNLTVQPKSLLVIGGGPIGCELGQGF